MEPDKIIRMIDLFCRLKLNMLLNKPTDDNMMEECARLKDEVIEYRERVGEEECMRHVREIRKTIKFKESAMRFANDKRAAVRDGVE